MSRTAITVENLSKAYHIGLKEDRADTLVGALHGLVRAPVKNFRRLSRMNTFRHQGEADDIFWALKDVSFEIDEGEVVGIIGRNGAGKSTLLKILSRITEPTAGRAVIRGRVSSLLEVGTGFHQELTGRENVYMNGTILGMTKREIDGKFDEIVDFSGVEKFLDTPIKHYSSGMKVRLAFAVAAHLEPEILIIDEVLAVGDMEFQKKCLGKMKDVALGGRTVLFVSHNMAAIESLCSCGFHLGTGQIVNRGPISDVVAAYQSHAMSAVDSRPRDFEQTRVVQRIEFLDGNGRPSNHVGVSQELRIRITFKSGVRLSAPRIYLGIEDLLGHRLLTLQPPVEFASLSSLVGQTTIECLVHNFPLAPGTYVLNLAILENRQAVERIQDCGAITVVNAPLFDEGRGFVRGVCVARSSWQAIAAFESTGRD